MKESPYDYLNLANDLIWLGIFRRHEETVLSGGYLTPSSVIKKFDETDPDRFFRMYQRAANWIVSLNRPNDAWLRYLNQGAGYVMKAYDLRVGER
jgi:hypothetical protein